MLRARLERETGPTTDRIREAITIANNEIHRRAALRAEWKGMACVLTVAVVENGRATIGHVGDTRLYKLRHGRIDKVTLDHSPIGEREDARELTEAEAMRHPRRNEVYRDVGSEPHEPADPGFIDIVDVPFEPDAALLLCSDGLTDAVPSTTVADVVREYAGHPYEIVRALIDAANESGGKDNVTVVYAEGPEFAAAAGPTPEVRDRPVNASAPQPAASGSPRWLTAALILLLVTIAGIAAMRTRDVWLPKSTIVPLIPVGPPNVIVVGPTASITDALRRAPAGATVRVEPGEYREQVRLVSGVVVESLVPRAAVIRLPGGASEAEAAVVAADIQGAAFSGFRVVGDAATPLGTGLYVRDATVKISDIEISGAKHTAVEFSGAAVASMIAADIHDNPGAGLAVRAGATPRIAHSQFSKNGLSQQAAGAIVIEAGARPRLSANIFVGLRCESLRALSAADCAANVFIPAEEPRPRAPGSSGRRGGRQ
jgi:hypothetical protein